MSKKNQVNLIISVLISAFVIYFFLQEVILSLNFFNILIILMTFVMIIQGLLTVYGMMYAWNNPTIMDSFKSPEIFEEPALSFTAIVPARNEVNVIGDTIRALDQIQYPDSLKQTIIVCQHDDIATQQKVNECIQQIGKSNIQLVTYNSPPFNKPHSLNAGLENATHEIIVVFDAEDEPHKDIYSIVNTVMKQKNVDVVQSGVQLMNYRSHWFSTLNVLEYFFWFKSVLPLFAKSGVIPLGGNTVFFKRNHLLESGGWNIERLTEDADIGFRLSSKGMKTAVVYDEKHATQEETPTSTEGFIKQRSRWNQGYIQLLKDGIWKQFKNPKQRILAFYILLWPVLQSIFFLYAGISIALAFYTKMNLAIVLFSLIPLHILTMQIIVSIIGLYEFCRDYNYSFKWWLPLKIIVTILPFYFIIGISGIRALFRMMTNNIGWEKTLHKNAHRNLHPLTISNA